MSIAKIVLFGFLKNYFRKVIKRNQKTTFVPDHFVRSIRNIWKQPMDGDGGN